MVVETNGNGSLVLPLVFWDYTAIGDADRARKNRFYLRSRRGEGVT